MYDQVGELISEPIAIALAHGLNRFKGEKTALICDFGNMCARKRAGRRVAREMFCRAT
jgi:hypothetical protein